MAWNAIGSGLCLQRSRLPPTRTDKCPPSSSQSHPTFSPLSRIYPHPPFPPPLNYPLEQPAMKYRSPSPESSLPTPPQSPRSMEATQSAIILLDSLTSFYQQERYWVHHTRAALELAISKGIDAPSQKSAITAPAHATLEQNISTTLLTTTSPSGTTSPDDTAMIKLEPMSAEDSLSAHTKWMRRKNIMKLKLDGISSHTKRRRPHRAPHTEPGARLLEMFSELVDARMESCQRISRLVQDAKRTEFLMC